MRSEEKARKSLSNEKCFTLLVQTEFNSKDMETCSNNNSTEM